MKNDLMKQIEQACENKEIHYNDLIELGLKYQTKHIDEIVRNPERVNLHTRSISRNKEPDKIKLIPFDQWDNITLD